MSDGFSFTRGERPTRDELLTNMDKNFEDLLMELNVIGRMGRMDFETAFQNAFGVMVKLTNTVNQMQALLKSDSRDIENLNARVLELEAKS